MLLKQRVRRGLRGRKGRRVPAAHLDAQLQQQQQRDGDQHVRQRVRAAPRQHHGHAAHARRHQRRRLLGVREEQPCARKRRRKGLPHSEWPRPGGAPRHAGSAPSAHPPPASAHLAGACGPSPAAGCWRARRARRPRRRPWPGPRTPPAAAAPWPGSRGSPSQWPTARPGTPPRWPATACGASIARAHRHPDKRQLLPFPFPGARGALVTWKARAGHRPHCALPPATHRARHSVSVQDGGHAAHQPRLCRNPPGAVHAAAAAVARCRSPGGLLREGGGRGGGERGRGEQGRANGARLLAAGHHGDDEEEVQRAANHVEPARVALTQCGRSGSCSAEPQSAHHTRRPASGSRDGRRAPPSSGGTTDATHLVFLRRKRCRFFFPSSSDRPGVGYDTSQA